MLFLANELVPEHQALEAQAAHSQGVDGLLTFVGEAQRIGIPAKFQAFQVGCALSDIFHQMVDEDLPYFLKIPPVVKKREWNEIKENFAFWWILGQHPSGIPMTRILTCLREGSVPAHSWSVRCGMPDRTKPFSWGPCLSKNLYKQSSLMLSHRSRSRAIRLRALPCSEKALKTYGTKKSPRTLSAVKYKV